MSYRIANANQFLVITGLGITDFVLCKKRFVLPLQNCNRFTITPLNYDVEINALTHEKLSIHIPAELTIGPNIDNIIELKKYVKLLVSASDENTQEQAIRERVTGIIEGNLSYHGLGEMRAVAANMTLEEIFSDRKHFQSKVFEYIQEALEKFGLTLYNANIKELKDSMNYFKSMGQKVFMFVMVGD